MRVEYAVCRTLTAATMKVTKFGEFLFALFHNWDEEKGGSILLELKIRCFECNRAAFNLNSTLKMTALMLAMLS